MRQRRNRKVIMYGLMVALMITTVAYALLQAQLNINGTVTKKYGTWDIHFENAEVLEEYGEVELTLPDPFPNSTASFDFDVLVTKPSDRVVFTVDVVNAGTIDAILYQKVLPGYEAALAQDIIYTVTYKDGTALNEGDFLPKKDRKTLKLTVEYKEESESLAEYDIMLDLGLDLLYQQTVGNEQEEPVTPGEPSVIPTLTSVTLTDLYNAGKIDNNAGLKGNMGIGLAEDLSSTDTTITFNSYAKVTLSSISYYSCPNGPFDDGSSYFSITMTDGRNITLEGYSGEAGFCEWGFYENGASLGQTLEGNIATIHIKIVGLLDISFQQILVPTNFIGTKVPELEPDTSLAQAPNLLNNSLTPVVYDESRKTWVVADTSKPWYNYGNQQWANAVILNSGVTKNIGDPIVVPTSTSSTSEVKAMYVWIPRYEYKIEGTYGTHTDGTAGTQALPGEIEVNFIPQSQTTATTGYILHPAFTWNVSENYDTNGNPIIEANEHLTGIWVGKFETTGTGDAPTILPNTSSLRSQNVSSQFATAQKLGTYLTNTSNTDSHMMKNSEWGAVAYLSQSVYGKYGNSAYTGANKEIYQNKSDSFLTGNSNGTPSTDTSNTQCTYDDIIDRGNGTGSCGSGASTTGNIYGIYDMSGGAVENVMGYLTTAYGTRSWGSTSDRNYAGFTSAPAGRYFDAYTTTTSTTACNGGICHGQALSETKGWYNDRSYFVSADDPWFVRGGLWNFDTIAGAFGSDFGNGNGYNDSGFRAVLFAPGA